MAFFVYNKPSMLQKKVPLFQIKYLHGYAGHMVECSVERRLQHRRFTDLPLCTSQIPGGAMAATLPTPPCVTPATIGAISPHAAARRFNTVLQ